MIMHAMHHPTGARRADTDQLPAYSVALLGAAGYTRLELAKLLAAHPVVTSACAASDTQASRSVEALTGRSHAGLAFVTTDAARAIASECRAALLAVPPEAARSLVPALRGHGTKVID